MNILLVNPNPVFTRAATFYLETEPGVECVAIAQTGKEALEKIAALDSDMVLIEITLPDMSGLELTALLKAQWSSLHVSLMGIYDTVEYREAAFAANADSYITKSEFDTQLLPLLQSLISNIYQKAS